MLRSRSARSLPTRRAVRLEATNHEGSFLGKNVSPAKFEAGKESGFAFADILFAIDLNNEIVLGDAFPEWRGNLYDIAMVPDMATLVEWKPGLDAVIGDYWLKDGTPVPICPRNLVKRLVAHLADHGYDVTVAVEIEATLFEESVHEARARGYRDLTPLGGSTGATYHLARSGDWVAYMEAVVERLDQVGITWEAWTDEAAPGQTELNLAPTDAVRLGDSWARTRQVMREVAHELGHTVSFMAKPTAGFGQGAHINISLQSDGVNRFFAEVGPSELMRHAVGGLLATMEGNTSIAFPQITSYGGQANRGEHGGGKAIDVMVSGALGYQVRDFLFAHRYELNLFDIIYSKQIWTIQRDGEGFRGMSDRGSATANHYDHVHVLVN